MATLSASDLYIIVCFVSYSGISGDTDTLYTDKAEAERVAAERSEHVFVGMKLKYSVMTLDDYISEVKSESYSDGQQAERNSASGNW